MKYVILPVFCVIIILVGTMVALMITEANRPSVYKYDNYTFTKTEGKVVITNNKDDEYKQILAGEYEEPPWMKWANGKKIDFKFQLQPKFRLIFTVDGKTTEIDIEKHFTKEEIYNWTHYIDNAISTYYRKEHLDSGEPVNLLRVWSELNYEEPQTQPDDDSNKNTKHFESRCLSIEMGPTTTGYCRIENLETGEIKHYWNGKELK